jgi:uridine kinase
VQRSQLLQQLARLITRIELPHPTRVAIDGPDAAGKTTLAEELVPIIQSHNRSVIRASIDGFHNPRSLRYRRGPLSPQGFFYDSFDYPALIRDLLIPLGPNGSGQYQTAVFDFRLDAVRQTATQHADSNTILLFDGVFLLRSELISYWDFRIFVEASFAVTTARAEQRDAALFGSAEEVERRYQQRYVPGQQLYFAECRPQERAQIVINNDDPSNPLMI